MHCWLAIAVGDGWWSQQLLSGSCLERLTSWLPNRFQMDCTGFLSLKVDLVPIIRSLSHAERGEFDCGFSNQVTIDNIFVEHFKVHVVSDVFDVDFEELI
jgi:hypothetical protein